MAGRGARAQPGHALPLPARRRPAPGTAGSTAPASTPTTSPTRTTSGSSAHAAAPGVARRHRRLPDLPRPLRLVRRIRRDWPSWATVSGRWDDPVAADWPARPSARCTAATWSACESRLDHIVVARRQPDLPHPVLPGAVEPPLRRRHVRPRRPAARRRRRRSLALVGGVPTPGGSGSSATSPPTTPATATSGSAPPRPTPRRPRRRSTSSATTPTTTWRGSTCRPCRSSTCVTPTLRRAPGRRARLDHRQVAAAAVRSRRVARSTSPT